MNLRRACCCSECECGGCDYASSYYTSGASLSGSWNYNSKFNPCTHYPCGDQEEDIQYDVDVVLSAIVAGGTITREGTLACCYGRVGYATVTYTVTITSRAKCCFGGGSTCTYTLTIDGSTSVPVRHTVVPQCVAGKICSWKHSIGLCAFQVGVHDWLLDITPDDCPLNCDELPLVRNGFIIDGCELTWITPYQALDTLVYGDFAFGGFCGPVFECGSIDPAVRQSANPFSVFVVSDWGGSTPPNCPTVLADLYFWFDSGEFPVYSPCSGDAELDAQCYSREFHFNAMPPLYA